MRLNTLLSVLLLLSGSTLTERQKITHFLNRITFGPRPGDAELVHKTGIEKYLDLQLHPERIPDLAIEERLAATPSIRMTVPEVIRNYPSRKQATNLFEMPELLARVEALLRRSSAVSADASGQIVQFGEITVDFRSTQAFREGQPLVLSAREFKLLRYFVEHRGVAISRDELLNAVWGYDAMPFTRTVDVHVAWLRQKLEPQPRNPQFILTVHGIGYRFVI